ncbi:PspA-associated protein PspAA [Pseudonocardia acidicola]|uniref:PspA-associated domain-containing protein n=1 Tax=Pseudonocardia acidicola TaxID=2724939 RepID=A0ABX1SE93_9PSEU|nr:hypothetical protein [Pseudonocardia acidicola]NMH99182.1 hypothetical protein [Pseudonocardia acidicola]
MIIRILGEGQFEVADSGSGELNSLDDRLLAAFESGDSTVFGPTLRELLATVRRLGTPLTDSELVASELVLPAADSDLAQVRALLGDDGPIPG